MSGLLSLVVLVLDVVAIIDLWKGSLDQVKKIIWTIVIIVLPLIGLIAWFFLVKKKAA